MRVHLSVTDVHFGNEDPEDLTSDILQILLHHLKLDSSACCNEGTFNPKEPGQTAKVHKHRR